MVCFRLTLEEAERIKAFQENHEIYRVLLGKKLGLDHNHKTGQVRGYLEWRINRAYGLLEQVCPDKLPELLRALAEFHENPPAVKALGGPHYGLIGKAKYKKIMVYGPPEEPGTKGRKTKK
jgi:hypothetical protein